MMRTKEKQAEAEQLGAYEVLVFADSKAMEAHELKFDFILVTISDAFEVNDHVKLAKRNGVIATVGQLGPDKGPLDNQGGGHAPPLHRRLHHRRHCRDARRKRCWNSAPSTTSYPRTK